MNNRPKNYYENIPLDDIAAAVAAKQAAEAAEAIRHQPETDDERDARRSAEEDVAAAEWAARVAERDRQDEADRDRRNADPVAAAQRVRLF